MIFLDIPAGAEIFLDANTHIYHFLAEPAYGAACTQLIKQIEAKQLQGFVSTDVLADVAHRLMTLETANLNGWPLTSLAARLRRHCTEIPKLAGYRQAIYEVAKAGIRVLPITQTLIESATILCGHHELLMGDALIVAVMQAYGLTHLASHGSDFDRVAGITRYGPV